MSILVKIFIQDIATYASCGIKGVLREASITLHEFFSKSHTKLSHVGNVDCWTQRSQSRSLTSCCNRFLRSLNFSLP